MKKVALILLTIGLIVGGVQQPNAREQVVAENVKLAATPADYMTIGLSPDEFKRSFNASTEASRSGFRITSLELKQGAGGLQFVYPFDSNIATMGTINKNDGTIRSLTTMASVVGTKESAVKVPLIMLALIRATNPALPEKDSATMAIDLFKKAVGKIGTTFEEVRNGLRYAAVFVQGSGMLFVVDQKR